MVDDTEMHQHKHNLRRGKSPFATSYLPHPQKARLLWLAESMEHFCGHLAALRLAWAPGAESSLCLALGWELSVHFLTQSSELTRKVVLKFAILKIKKLKRREFK